jgi:hypothetical protein
MEFFYSGVLGALLGALVSGTINWQVNLRSVRLQTTVRLLDEWHSAEMRQWRQAAVQFLDAQSDKGIAEAWSLANEDQKHAISNVAHFFEKFAHLEKASYLIAKFARDSMGGVIGFWCPKLLGDTALDSYHGEWRALLLHLNYLKTRFSVK